MGQRVSPVCGEPVLDIVPITALPDTAVRQCLTEAGAVDLFLEPWDRPLPQGTMAAVVDDVVVGVGWLMPRPEGLQLDVRVHPRHRRAGVGAALADRLATPSATMVARCDSGHRSAIQFVEGLGFGLHGMVFGQRWDGDPEEVPPAFRTAALEDAEDRRDAWRFLCAARADTENAPAFDEALLQDPETRVRLARRNGALVGICAARRVPDAWRIGGLSVTPNFRRYGIGRILICDLMDHAARDGLGVIIKVSAAQEQLVHWTRELGFYTYRTWADYRRAPTT